MRTTSILSTLAATAALVGGAAVMAPSAHASVPNGFCATQPAPGTGISICDSYVSVKPTDAAAKADCVADRVSRLASANRLHATNIKFSNCLFQPVHPDAAGAEVHSWFYDYSYTLGIHPWR